MARRFAQGAAGVVVVEAELGDDGAGLPADALLEASGAGAADGAGEAADEAPETELPPPVLRPDPERLSVL